MNVEIGRTEEWKVGDRVRNLPEHSWVRHGSAWSDKMALPRQGTIIEVPMAARDAGEGTLLVEWDSLGAAKTSTDNWRMWIHSSFIAPVEEVAA